MGSDHRKIVQSLKWTLRLKMAAKNAQKTATVQPAKTQRPMRFIIKLHPFGLNRS
jgi:hypothetical protein